MPRHCKATILILGYVCIVTTLLIIVFKPWEVVKATPQTRATPTALIDSNSIITPESDLPLPRLPVAEVEEEGIYNYVDHIRYLPEQSAVVEEVETKPKKKKRWFRFASPARQQ